MSKNVKKTIGFTKMKCYKCSEVVPRVDQSADKVLCWKCTVLLTNPHDKVGFDQK